MCMGHAPSDQNLKKKISSCQILLCSSKPFRQFVSQQPQNKIWPDHTFLLGGSASLFSCLTKKVACEYTCILVPGRFSGVEHLCSKLWQPGETAPQWTGTHLPEHRLYVHESLYALCMPWSVALYTIQKGNGEAGNSIPELPAMAFTCRTSQFRKSIMPEQYQFPKGKKNWPWYWSSGQYEFDMSEPFQLPSTRCL